MKRRTLLIVLGSLVLVVAVLLAAVRLPATQRFLLLRSVADVPGLVLTVERVSAGPTGAELRGILADYQGTKIRLPLVEARYDGWAFLLGRELVVGELKATDLEIELPAAEGSAETPAAATESASTATAQAFAGLLAPLQLPLRATVDSIQLGGRVRFSETQNVRFSAQGRLLLPGRAAATDIHIEWADSAEAAAARELDWVGRVTTTAAEGGAIERVAVNGTLAMPKAKAGGPEHGLVTDLVVARDAAGAETVDLTVRLSTAKEKDVPLAKFAMAHKAGAELVAGTWSVNLRREQLEGVVDLNQLPDFVAVAQGAFGIDAASGDFSADGQATLSASRLQRLRREWAGLGSVAAKLDFAVERKGEALQLARLAATVNDARGPVLKLAALQPVTYRLDTGAVAYAQPGQDLVQLELDGLSLAWAQPWLGDTMLAGTIGPGEVRLKGAGGAWSVETPRALGFNGVRYARGGRIVAEQLGGELGLRAAVDGTAWSLDRFDLTLRSAAAGAFDAIAVQATAAQDAAGSGRLALPLTLDHGGRRSQLTLAGEWTLTDRAKTVNARLTGDTVHLQDLGALAALVPESDAPAAATPTSGDKNRAKAKAAPAAPLLAAKDERAFWAGVEGRVEVDFKRLVLESEELTGLQAVLVCNAQTLTLEKLTARTRSAPLDAKVAVTFDAAKSAPYGLRGSCTFPGFDLGAWLRAANPAEEPVLESVLDVAAKLEGQGANLAELLHGVRGDFTLKGGPGVLRIKDKRVEAASALGGLVLGLLSKEKQKPVVAAGAQLLEEMREFRFERIDLSLLRAEDLDLSIRMIDLRSAEKRLSGTGMAKHAAGRTIDEYPLELEMRLAGKENFAAMLDEVKLLDGTKDGLGYLVVREPFTVTGTVGEPNWKKMLMLFGAGLVLGK
jgi:hypothetical protein